MSVKTLNSIQALSTSTPASFSQTYSIPPLASAVPMQATQPLPTQMELFLEAENPLGCFRGVMWVMAFNAAVFVLGFTIWQSCKLIW